MRTLFYKDYLAIVFALCAGLSACGILIFDSGYDDTFVFPLRRYFDELPYAWVITGLVFGLWVGSVDKLRGTTDYLYHRPMHSAQMFWGQVGWHLLTMLAVMVLPFLALYFVGSSNFEGEFWGVGWPKVLTSTAVLPCYAAGFLVSRLPVPLWLRCISIGLAALLASGLALTIQFGGSEFPLALAGINCLLAMVCLCGAWLGTLHEFDPDRPLGKLSIVPISLWLVAMGFIANLGITLATNEGNARKNIHVAQSADGSFHPARSVYDKEKGALTSYRVDPETHANLIEDDSLQFISKAKRQYYRLRDGSCLEQYSSLNGSDDLMYVRTFAHAPTGFMAHYGIYRSNQATRWILARPEGAFSKQATLLDKRRADWDRTAVVGDPQDGTIWVCDFSKEEPGYQSVALGQGLGFQRWIDRTSQLNDVLASELKLDKTSDTGKQLVRETAIFEVDGGFAWLNIRNLDAGLFGPESLAAIQDWAGYDSSDKPRLHTVENNLFFPKWEIRSPTGEALFAYQYAPRTLAERVKFIGYGALSCWRSPIVNPFLFANVQTVPGVTKSIANVNRYSRGPELSQAAPTRFAASSFIGWVLLLVVAFLVRFRLKRIGAQGKRLWVWPAVILLFGLTAAVLSILLESRRAHRRVRLLETQDEPKVWLRSAS